MFRISVTSSSLNAFVMVSQTIASPLMIRLIYSHNLVSNSYHVSHFSQFIIQLQLLPFGILTFFEAGMDIFVFVLT